MASTDRLDKLTNRMTHDRRVILGELVALGLLTYKSRIWEDPGLRRVGHTVTLLGSRAKEKTTGWVEVQSGRIRPLNEMLQSEEEGGDEQHAMLIEMKKRLETSLGTIASDAEVQVRPFSIGEEPNWSNRAKKMITGTIHLLRAPNPDGTYTSVEEVTIDQTTDFSPPHRLTRLRSILEKFNELGGPS